MSWHNKIWSPYHQPVLNLSSATFKHAKVPGSYISSFWNPQTLASLKGNKHIWGQVHKTGLLVNKTPQQSNMNAAVAKLEHLFSEKEIQWKSLGLQLIHAQCCAQESLFDS